MAGAAAIVLLGGSIAVGVVVLVAAIVTAWIAGRRIGPARGAMVAG